MIRMSIFAAAFAIGTAGAASAQAFHEANADTYVPPSVGNVVGGGAARLIGGGSDSSVQRESAGTPAQRGRAAQFGSSGGGEAEITYVEPVPAGARGRDAMLLGGGDNAMIVYLDSPRSRRG